MLKGRNQNAFTLIEMLVVVAVIVLLIAILLPSLQSARQHAKTVVCSSNMHNVGVALGNYLFVSKGAYPASYVYPSDLDGNWTPSTQSEGKSFGYLHWSNYLYESGQVSDKAFQCPVVENGGAPRTNPGDRLEDWEAGEQIDEQGQNKADPGNIKDKQAPRMAYTANAAIMPRNKFNTVLSGGPRANMFVKDSTIKYPGATIVVAEFLNNWKAMAVYENGGLKSKSHRPVNPFYHIGSGFNEYAAAVAAPGFIYGLPNDQDMYGILPLDEVKNKQNILDHTSGVSQINAVGRHHPSANAPYAKKYGGTSNFLFCDGHAEGMTPLDTMTKRYWGNRYTSLTGESQVMNMSKVASVSGN